MIRRREISSRELLEHYLERIERLNPALNAVVTLDPDGARKRADAADDALVRGGPVGPLHGLPLTVKDTLETAGIRTTAGFPPLRDHVPETSAPSVERLLRGGAILFGKTNTPPLAGDAQTANPIFGRTNNPWDVTRSPGGSSGGAAAALAAGLTGLELGSDIGGSIRMPAHACGVYGHKPTHGLVPLRGHIPGPPGTRAETDLGTVGPLARGAEDLDLALGLIAGPLEERAGAWQLSLPEPRRIALRGYRVAAWLEEPGHPVQRGIARRLEAVVRALREAGVRVDEGARPDFGLSEVLETYQRLVWPVLLSGYPKHVFEGLVERVSGLPVEGDDDEARMLRFGTARHRDWLEANETRERLRALMGELFRTYDVLLCPAAAVPAIPHDPSEPIFRRTISVDGVERPYLATSWAWIALASVALLPATVAPIGTVESGLPAGIQIVGPYLEDRTPIDFARRLAEIVGGFAPPPLVEFA